MSGEFEEVVDRCQRRIFTYACYLLGNPATAEDVTQDAFVRLWVHWASIDLERVEGWLTRVTRNLCYDRLRRSRTADRHLALVPNAELEAVGDPLPGPRDRAEASEFRLRFREALSELSEPAKSTLILREILGLQYVEIAEALEIPLNSVRVYIHRGRRRKPRFVTAVKLAWGDCESAAGRRERRATSPRHA